MTDPRRLSLEQVITTGKLHARASRSPDHEAENRALAALMQTLADQPPADQQTRPGSASTVLQKLVETALELCHAHSAGVSILEKEGGQEVFRWRAAAGLWSIYLNDVMPRDSPCGTVIDRNAAILMSYPERHRFPYAQATMPPIVEALLIPFQLSGRPVGTIWIISHDNTRRFDAEDQRLMASLGRLAANAYRLLNEEQLVAELVATRRLQEISTRLLGEEKEEALYEKIVDAASTIMRSEFASLQMLYPERADGELRLLTFRGFSAEAAKFWERVRAADVSTCGRALHANKRVIVSDVEKCEFMAGSDTLRVYRQTGIRAIQTTPLVSRGGQVLGMISTHWVRPHDPSEQDLRLFDVLARQAADLMERSLTQQRTRMLLREVSHRGKNLLAVVQAMARQTANAADPATFAHQFSARLACLAAIQDLLVKDERLEVDARELISSQLSHLKDAIGTRITLHGPTLRIAPGAAQTIGMAVHELSTNAAKYGALSNSSGVVEIEWRILSNPSRVFAMSWRERNGPLVDVPQRQGFGHTIIVRTVKHALDASVALDYAPTGVQWEFSAPAAAVLIGWTPP